MKIPRYYFDQDNTGHWYVIPVNKRRQWYIWLSLPEDDEAGWEQPYYVRRLDGPVQAITFENPRGL